ncbi:MAG: type II toxin-antitoxin system death-on-curing family toxin [Selenomonadaceae bacterium]|nr:type II toxin-antitoxin system death-on-curing family toxin [Selenomonadaceae bacterium]
MINLLLKNIFTFHRQLDAGREILNHGLIESAVNAPFQTFGGQSLYPTIFDKAAQLGFGLTKNHGFADGNKRVALHAMELLLLLNGIKLTCSQEARVNIMMSVASGKCSAAQLKNWLLSNSERFPSVIVSGTITIKNAD